MAKPASRKLETLPSSKFRKTIWQHSTARCQKNMMAATWFTLHISASAMVAYLERMLARRGTSPRWYHAKSLFFSLLRVSGFQTHIIWLGFLSRVGGCMRVIWFRNIYVWPVTIKRCTDPIWPILISSTSAHCKCFCFISSKDGISLRSVQFEGNPAKKVSSLVTM